MKSILLLGVFIIASVTANAGVYWKGFQAVCKSDDGKIVAMVDNEKFFMRGNLMGFFPKENLFGTLKSIRSHRAVEDIRYEMPIEVVAEAKDHAGFPYKMTVDFDRRNEMVTIILESFQKNGEPANKFRHVERCDSLTYSF